MNLQSKINAVESRINQISNSDLFTDQEKAKLISINSQELYQLRRELRNIKVNQPQLILATN